MSIKIGSLTPLKGNTLYRDIDKIARKSLYSDEIRTLKNESAIRQNIKNWLYTRRGQRPNSPRWGNKFHEFLFQPVTRFNAQLLGEEVLNLENDISSVKVESVDVVIHDEGFGFDITFFYSIPELDIFKEEFKLQFFKDTGIIV